MSGIINEVGSKSYIIGMRGSQSGTCSFMARESPSSSTGWSSIGSPLFVPFTDDSSGDCHDTDSCYDATNSKFVAPTSGVYCFWYAIYTAEGDDDNGFAFDKNGAQTGIDSMHESTNYLTYVNIETGDHIQNGFMQIVLDAGDYIKVVVQVDSHVYHEMTTWGGYRIK